MFRRLLSKIKNGISPATVQESIKIHNNSALDDYIRYIHSIIDSYLGPNFIFTRESEMIREQIVNRMLYQHEQFIRDPSSTIQPFELTHQEKQQLQQLTWLSSRSTYQSIDKWEAHGQMYEDIQQMALQFQQQSLLTQDLGNGSFIHTFAETPSNAAGAIFAFDPTQYYKYGESVQFKYKEKIHQKGNCGKWACPFCVEEFSHDLRNQRFLSYAVIMNFTQKIRQCICNDFCNKFSYNIDWDAFYNFIIRFGQFDFPIPNSEGFEIFL